ncbi:fatty acid desaturase [Nocardioidaceae bacterium]|nr:fatty acid desaturase [Nocardioidaceae bacterium]
MWALTGWTAWFWIGPVVILGIVPAIDLVVGLDRSNPPDDVIESLENDKYYRWVTYAYLPIQYVGFIGAFALIGLNDSLPWYAKLGIAVSIGCVGGIGINTAHELGHKKESHERWLAKIALAQVAYGHFYIEHNRGHHVRVATPEDPASSRLGETFYAFWPRTVSGSLTSAWSIEKKRYARKDTHPFHLGNDVLNAWLMTAVLWGGIIAAFGWITIPFLLVQAVVGFSLLEVVNYMEHYGMLRQKVGPEGRRRYERCDPSHSWNSNNIATNVLLYHLQRHSDHHANPTRRYQALRDFEESPVLPTGYAGMILLALFPPLWRRVMDRRVLDHFEGDVTRANIQPSKRERILAKYGTHATDGSVPAGSRDLGPEAEQLTGAAEQSAADIEVLAARCPNCAYVYEVAAGEEREGFPAGTAWNDIPEDWFCPDCGVRDKVDFTPVDPETHRPVGQSVRSEAERAASAETIDAQREQLKEQQAGQQKEGAR